MVFAPTIEGNLARMEDAASRAAAAGADAILFPECATTGYSVDFATLGKGAVEGALDAVAAMAARHRVQVLAGSPVFMGRRLLNALVVFDRAGRLVHGYAKCHLTGRDRLCFVPGDGLSWFRLGEVTATAIICHERRYPELVRLPVMAGAQVVFHPNAGLDDLAVSRSKRGGRDGIPVRAFENAVFYVFANSVGPQGNGKWSAGGTKVVAPDGTVLGLADNRSAALVVADLDLSLATRKYAEDAWRHPRLLVGHWRAILRKMTRRARITDEAFRLALAPPVGRRRARQDVGA